MSPRRLPSILLLVVLCFGGVLGCKPKPKEVSGLDRKKAANLASEAVFAVQVRDIKRAEDLFAQATVLDPETPDYWVSLGASRKRLGDTSGARKAYEGALAAHERAYAADGKSPEPLLHQARVLALLGKLDGARKVLDKAVKIHGNDRDLKAFIDSKAFDQMLADNSFKEIAL